MSAQNTNRLGREKSPYLLQHQHNPVDWFPWGEEAFARARQEDKPIFLSIGYSTCHWCHVMERESFENSEIAAFLKAHFISIKVDREERPDVDKIYMTTAQAMTGQGGWPLNCFLTPQLKPFYAGTYFPPEGKYGQPGFLPVLRQIAKLWQSDRGKVLASASDLHGRLAGFVLPQPDSGVLAPRLLDQAAAKFKQEYDPQHGGFGGAPKFPRPSLPAFLLRHGARARDAEAVQMVLHTCDAMAAGGMHDQLGGGFARYSVDAQWLVPHFEKMLYDNAQLLNLYLDAFLVSGEARHAAVARGIIAYVLRDMTHPQGGFYSAEDADSEGKEGKFYCWTTAELSQLLTPEEFQAATRYFGVTGHGNFTDHSDPAPLPNQNVLSVAEPELPPAAMKRLDSARKKMFDARSRRVRPRLDDKVLASWNGMMLGALARAAVILGDDRCRAAAEKNLAFLREKLWDGQTLYHRWRDGERDTVQLLRAYAELLAGTLDLYETTLQPAHLDFALALAAAMLARFYDPDDGGFFDTVAGAKDLILRVKEDYDGAEPSGNAVAALALLRLGAITGRAEFRNAAEKTLRLLSRQLQEFPQAVPHLLLALDFYLTEPHRAVVTGGPGRAETAALLRAVHAVYQPGKVVLGNAGPVEPFARTLPDKDAPLVYVCTGSACQAPTNDAAKVREMLQGR
ncbi:MAG: thioredoxin domain-containing protein [Verrucomicrobiota bacterium]